MSNIYICTHCAEKCSEGKSLCRSCGTAEQRKKMCEENKENNPKHTCKICDNTQKNAQ